MLHKPVLDYGLFVNWPDIAQDSGNEFPGGVASVGDLRDRSIGLTSAKVRALVVIPVNR